jgi:hypothetical protein
MKRSWPNLWYYPGICKDELKESIKISRLPILGLRFEPVTCRIRIGDLTIRLRHLIATPS